MLGVSIKIRIMYCFIKAMFTSCMRQLYPKKDHRTNSRQTRLKRKNLSRSCTLQIWWLVLKYYSIRYSPSSSESLSKRPLIWNRENKRFIWIFSMLQRWRLILIYRLTKMDGALYSMWREVLCCLFKWRWRRWKF